MDYDTKKRF